MSVLIKDMEMPKSCNECKLDLRTDICKAFCEWNAEHPYSIRATDRLPDCPLSEASELCEDAVSRNLVLSEVKSGMIRTIDGENWKRVSENVRDIKALPPVQLGTNLAEVGTELVSRQAVMDLWDRYRYTIAVDAMRYDAELRELPAVQPEIIRCKDCKYAVNVGTADMMCKNVNGWVVATENDFGCVLAEQKESETWAD